MGKVAISPSTAINARPKILIPTQLDEEQSGWDRSLSAVL